jgi:hypothetical protein
MPVVRIALLAPSVAPLLQYPPQRQQELQQEPQQQEPQQQRLT